jgi:EmrB/QacA subfamily drug resistance transporter
MTPVGMAMLWRVFPPAERVRASGILVLPTALAPAIGPVLGGLFVTDVSWRWVFYVNVPIGLASLVFGLVCLGDQRLGQPGAFDLPGFLLAGAGLGAVMYGLSEGPVQGWRGAEVVACAAGAAMLAALVVVELRRAAPLIDLRLLGDRLFAVSNLVLLLGSIAFIGTLYLVSLFFQDGLGLSALATGLSTFPEAAGVMVGATYTTRYLYPVLGPRRIMCVGLAIASGTMIALVGIGPGTSLWWARLAIFVMGLGMSGMFIPTQTAAFTSISHQHMGAASTLFNANRQLGGAVGVAVLTTVLAAFDPLEPVAGRLTPHLVAYRAAFVVAAALALAGAALSFGIHDQDAAPTMTRWKERRVGIGDAAGTAELPFEG